MRTPLGCEIAVSALAVVLACPGGVCAQGLTGRFYPEKETYLLGEPVFIVYQVKNEGEKSVRWGSGSFYGPCTGGFTFEVPGVVLQPAWQPSCHAISGSCLESVGELGPGQESIQHFLLNERFDFKEPGEYDVTARTPAPVQPDSDPLEEEEFKSSFRITLVRGDPAELQAAFQPYVQRLKKDDTLQAREAAVAVTKLAPPFLEDLIEALARDSDGEKATLAIDALLRMNTPQARETLAQLAEQRRFQVNGIEQKTIETLGKTGDRAYLQVLVGLAKDSYRFNRYSAALAAGELGRAEAVPFLLSLLQDRNPLVRKGAVGGLAGTQSREAVPGLLSMFTDPDAEVRESAVSSFTSLTHAPGVFNTVDAAAAERAKTRAARWWLLNGERSSIYGPQGCSETQPLR